MKSLEKLIRTIPDYPKPGILFRDVTTLFGNAKGFKKAIKAMAKPYQDQKIDAVAGIEARGFILGGAIADRLGCGFIPIRKKGKLPWKTIGQEYTLEYGVDVIEMPVDMSMQVAKALGSLTMSLGGIKDEATAKTALPGLQDLAKQIDGFKAATAALPAEGKKPIASLVAAALPSITAAVEKALGVPGAGALITPVLEPVVINLAALAKS